MQLNQIEGTLPNGFHDAHIWRLTLDFERREALFEIEIWVGDLSARNQEARDAYRLGELRLLGLVYCILEPPGPGSSVGDGHPLWIDGGEYASGAKVQRPGVPLPDGCFAYWFFVNNWNSFIHVAAMDAQFAWKE